MFRSFGKLDIPVLVAVLGLLFTAKTSAQIQNTVGAGQPHPAISVLDSTKEQDGLVGSVRRVKTESAKVEEQDGRPVEGARQLLELTTYGINGNRIENTSYPGRDSLIGKEEYKYDSRGNIIEMTLRDDQGTIVSKEGYSYEFDAFGNWTKMVTSLLVFENGQLKSEPVEVTYRTLTYYFNDSIAKIATAVKKLPTPLEPTDVQFLRLEKDINFRLDMSRQISGTGLEAAGTPPPIPSKPSRVGKIVAGDNLSNTSTLNQPLGAPASLTPRNGSVVAAVRPEGSPENIKPSPEGVKKAALEYYRTASTLVADGDTKAAIEFYLEAIELDSQSAEVFLGLGAAYVKLDKNADAAKAFNQAVKLNPGLSEAQYGLGLAYFHLHRYREAVVAMKKATSLDPKMAKAHFGLAMAYQELTENNFAVEEYRIVELLDKELAKRLAKTLRDNNSGCWIKEFCH